MKLFCVLACTVFGLLASPQSVQAADVRTALKEIFSRDLETVDPLGPSIDFLRGQGKSWDEIIKSATRTGGKDLGF